MAGSADVLGGDALADGVGDGEGVGSTVGAGSEGDCVAGVSTDGRSLGCGLLARVRTPGVGARASGVQPESTALAARLSTTVAPTRDRARGAMGQGYESTAPFGLIIAQRREASMPGSEASCSMVRASSGPIWLSGRTW